ncbi:hypothetical protein MRB53_007206 [Persea americana]|uniref:Uncharacterized protein n=1 Tax=Persea americana TaxID=3435 RepID=A0ACC2MII9_PERAE|nr:hypothetical protein MRB53_007206 [Persea americana]
MEKSELVFVPSPGAGHLISTVELAKHFHEKQQFSITILLIHLKKPSLQSKTTSYIQSIAASHPDIRFVNLPYFDLPSNEDQNPITFVSLIMEKEKPHVKEAIKTLSSPSSSSSSSSSTPVAALILDLFATTMIDVGVELSIPTYIYYTSGLGSLGFMLHLPTLDVKIPCEYKDYQGEVEVPSMSPFPVFVLPHPMMNKKDDEYTWYVYHGRRFREAKGLIVNTFAELEPKALQAIVDEECLPDHHPTPPLYLVGPVLALEEESQEPQTSQLMKWLDQQPPSSVVFLCFGSLGTFSVEQLKEMALGLEHSGYRFLWSLRCRSSTDTDLDKILPDGFLDRTQGWGLVVQSWVPQVAILGHVAVGGFVSHCGWNSTLESIWFGVPILAWPLYAEQKLNAFQLVRDCSLAVELSLDYEKDGWVSAEELEKGVRCLMGESEEGHKVRKRVEEMAKASKKAVEGGGPSFSALELLSNKLMV